MKIEQNISRLIYLMSLYKMTIEELLYIINEGLKNTLKKEDITSKEINLNYLKRIDKIFNKGLHFYLDPKSPEISQDASIFFRKNKLGVELNIGAKKIVNKFEELKISLSAIAKLAELKMERILPVYSIQQNPKVVAEKLRKEVYPEFTKDKKEFIISLIGQYAEKNILVLEFVETWNKKEKANIDGFFLNPNVIVLKRQPTSFRREIFTLVHELGHFLINEEDVYLLDYQYLINTKLNVIEKWCNDFAYYFLAGEYDTLITNINKADNTNDYQFKIIEEVSKNTHLSQIALFTRLLFQNKLSQENYNKIKQDFDEKYLLKKQEEDEKRELQKQLGIKSQGSPPKPINSPLLVSTIQSAFYSGIINEYDVCKVLNIKPDKLDRYIQ